ncbi:MAG: hypothetical protein ABIH86_04745 [Planctomycetota bacterium]
MICIRLFLLILAAGWLIGACGQPTVIRPEEIIDRETGEPIGAFKNKELKVWDHEKGEWIKVENQTTPTDSSDEKPRGKKRTLSPAAARALIEENERNVREALRSYVIRQHAALMTKGDYALNAGDLSSLSVTSLMAACDPPRALPTIDPPSERVAYDYVFYPIRKVIRSDGSTIDARDVQTGKRVRHALIAVPLLYGETGSKTFLATGDAVYYRDAQSDSVPALAPEEPLRFGWTLDERIGLVVVERLNVDVSANSELPAVPAPSVLSASAVNPPRRFDMTDPLSFNRIPSSATQTDAGAMGSTPDTAVGSQRPSELAPPDTQQLDGFSPDERLIIDALAMYGSVLTGSTDSPGTGSVLASARTAGKIPDSVFNAFIYEPTASVEAYQGFFFVRFDTAEPDTVIIAWPKNATPTHHFSFALFANGEIRCLDKTLKRVRAVPDDCRSWRLIGRIKGSL